MDEGKCICINNSYDPDKLGEDGAEFFGRMIIAMVWAAARRRASVPDNKKKPVYFFIDEASYVIQRDTTMSKIIQQCRSQKIAMIFSHQEMQQIKNEDVKSALTNCAIKFANSSGEAHELAPRLQTAPDFIKQQKRGQFACSVLDLTDGAVSISVPHIRVFDDHTFVDYPPMQAETYQRIISSMHASFCFTPPEEQAHEPQPDPQPQPHAQQPDDDTLYWKISISPKKAKSGTTHILQVLADPSGMKKPIAVKIPANTKDGARLRLRGIGAFRRDGSRGDVVLTIRVPDFTKNSQVTLYGDADPDEIG